MSSPAQQIEDFVQGQRDCKNGVEHKTGKSREYDAGYALQYEIEQRAAA